MWTAIGLLALLLIVGWLAVRLFFHERWTLIQIQWHMSHSRYERALPILRRQLDRLRRTKGENHLSTAVAKYSVGQIDYEHGRKEDGRRLVDEASAFFAAYSGRQDEIYWVHLNNLGLAQRSIDRRDQAIETFRQALDLQRKLRGPESDPVAQALNNLGATLDESGRPEESIPIYEEALKIRTTRHGAESYEAAKVRVNLAEAYTNLQQFAAAERNIEQAIPVLQPAPLKELGQAYDTYARLLEAQECLTRAEPMRIQALGALQRALGDANVEVAQQMEKYASLLERLNRRTECDLFRQKAAAIRQALA